MLHKGAKVYSRSLEVTNICKILHLCRAIIISSLVFLKLLSTDLKAFFSAMLKDFHKQVPVKSCKHRAQNNGWSPDNVQTDWGVDGSTFHLASHVDPSHSIVLKMKYIKISTLFSGFSCYQYVESRCVLQNFNLKSWVKCN